MAIVSISKIQNRYGLAENIPQLSAAELGWVIDERKLYIGNGPISEGAPIIGNTEILTEFSDILNVASDAYTYKDDAVGITAQTGVTTLTPITRSLQEKLDDFANVRDYGAVGDGVTDDTDAINRALYDLFSRDTAVSVRRTLFFPAGIYVVTDVIQIPTWASIQGEGLECTVIKATDNTVACVARTADSKQQVGASLGNNSAIFPSYVDIADISFYASVNTIDVFLIDAATQIKFDRVGFVGMNTTAPTGAGDGSTAIRLSSTATVETNHILFENCEIRGTNFGVIADQEMQNILFNSCKFTKLYRGVLIGENIDGIGPKGIRVTNSLFDEIYSVGIYSFSNSNFLSAYNSFLDVSDHSAGAPNENVIIFSSGGGSSISDYFLRSDIDNLIVARIDFGNNDAVFVNPNDGAYFGLRKIEMGGATTLLDNTAAATSTGILFTTTQKSQKIHYMAERGNNVRHGIFTITATANGVTTSDEFTEDGTDIGLTLSVSVVSTTVTVNYVTTSTGANVTFSYGVDRIFI